MPLTLIEAPAAGAEPITLEQAKAQVRKTDAFEDALFTDVLIPAVRDRAEGATQRQLIQATWRLWLDAWPCEGWIDIPKPPLIRVTEITYVDLNGDTQTLATTQYDVDAPVGPRCARGRVVPAYNVTWPSARAQANAIAVTFEAGYGPGPEDIPALLRMAMLRDLASLFAHREDVLTGPAAADLPRSSASVYRQFRSYPRQRSAA